MVNIISKYVKIPNSRVYSKEIIGTYQSVSMLARTSSVKVKVQCENCNNIFERPYRDICYLQKYICRSCFYETRKGVPNLKNRGNIPWNKGKNNFLSEESLKSMKKKLKGREIWNKGLAGTGCQEAWNKGLTGIWSEEQIENNRYKNTYHLSDYQKKYPLFCKIEELRENKKTYEIQARCKYHKCKNSKEQGGWFNLTKKDIYYRLWSIYHSDGGLYFYCSEECKQKCSLFGKTAIQLNNEIKRTNDESQEVYYTQEEYKVCREEVFRRDNNQCLYCGQKAEHMHHIRPQKLEPFFSLDPDYCISVCKECHYKYGHKDECSTGQLAQKICE